MSLRFFFLISFVTLAARAGATEFHPPSDWKTHEVPNLPTELRSAKKASSPDEGVEVTLIEAKVPATPAEMERMIEGQLSGMTKKGFALERSGQTTFQGFPARHFIGEFRSPEFEGAYLMDSYTVFSDTATILLSISIDDARGGRERGADLAKWVTISGAPLAFDESEPRQSDAYSMGERIGKYTVYGVFGLAILQIIRRRASKRPKAGGST